MRGLLVPDRCCPYAQVETASCAPTGHRSRWPCGSIASTKGRLRSITAITGHDVALAKVSDELSQDAPYLLAALALDLQSAIISRENSEIITTINATSGILTETGVANTVIDLVGSSVAGQQSLSGIEPVAVIAHPNQAAIRALKSSAQEYHVDPWSAGPPAFMGSGSSQRPRLPLAWSGSLPRRRW